MHMRDNVKEQCRKLGVDQMLTKEIMGDIFEERSGDLKLRKSAPFQRNGIVS